MWSVVYESKLLEIQYCVLILLRSHLGLNNEGVVEESINRTADDADDQVRNHDVLTINILMLNTTSYISSDSKNMWRLLGREAIA